MTRVYVDAKEISLPPPCFESLDLVLRHIETNELPPHTVIRQVEVDGSPVLSDSGADGTPYLPAGVAASHRIEVITGAISDIAAESIKEAICSAFNTPPSECSQQLSTASEAAGFGAVGAGGGTAASGAACG